MAFFDIPWLTFLRFLLEVLPVLSPFPADDAFCGVDCLGPFDLLLFSGPFSMLLLDVILRDAEPLDSRTEACVSFIKDMGAQNVGGFGEIKWLAASACATLNAQVAPGSLRIRVW